MTALLYCTLGFEPQFRNFQKALKLRQKVKYVFFGQNYFEMDQCAS